jgi:hypothetical protein
VRLVRPGAQIEPAGPVHTVRATYLEPGGARSGEAESAEGSQFDIDGHVRRRRRRGRSGRAVATDSRNPSIFLRLPARTWNATSTLCAATPRTRHR